MKYSGQGANSGSSKLFTKRMALQVLVLSLSFMLVALAGSVQAFAGSSQCTRTYDGDLVLTGHQVLAITGETVCVHGNVVVKDNAKLVLKDVTLRMDKFSPSYWDNWARFDVFNSANVEINNVVFDLSGGAVWLASHDQAVVHLDNVTSSGDSSGVHFQADGNSQVHVTSSSLNEADISASAHMTIQDSQLAWAVKMGLQGDKKILLTGIAPGKFDNWEFPTDQSVPFRISLQNTSVGAWAILVGEGTDVRIIGCKIDDLLLNLGQAKGSLHGLVPGHFVSWSLHADNQINCATKVELQDTTTNRWNLDLSGRSEITLNDSTIADLRFTDAYVDLSLKNVKASLLEANDALGKITSLDSSITGGVEFDNATLTVNGNLSFFPDCYVSEWRNSTIIRDFPIVVEKDFETPASHTPVEIALPNGRKLYQTTDDNGKTSFQCTFTASTYQDTCQLQVAAGKKEIKHSVGFLESTPVTISLLRADTSSDALFVATAGALRSLDPYEVGWNGNASLFYNVYEPLFLADINVPLAVTPLLAAKVPTVENGLIKLRANGACDITIPIRAGVRFHDGTPLTAADAEYSLELSLLHNLKDALSPTLTQAVLGTDSCNDLIKQVGLEEVSRRVQAAVETNDDEVVLHLQRPFSPTLATLSGYPILSKGWMTANGGWNGTPQDWERYSNLAPDEAPLNAQANGTGPFILENYTPNARLILVRNETYWRTPAKLKRVILTPVGDWKEVAQDLKSGKIDMIDYLGLRAGNEQHELDLQSIPGVATYQHLLGTSIEFVVFNRSTGKTNEDALLPAGSLDESSIPMDFFSDIDTRKGFIYSFDFGAFANAALPGEADRYDGPSGKACPDYESQYSYNPAKAIEHFKHAWGGRLWDTGFTVAITYNKGNEVRRIAAETLKQGVEGLNPRFHILVSGIPFDSMVAKIFADSLPLFVIGLKTRNYEILDPSYAFENSTGVFGGDDMPACDKLVQQVFRTMHETAVKELLCDLEPMEKESALGVFWRGSVMRVQQPWIAGWAYSTYDTPARLPPIYFYPIWKDMKEG